MSRILSQVGRRLIGGPYGVGIAWVPVACS